MAVAAMGAGLGWIASIHHPRVALDDVVGRIGLMGVIRYWISSSGPRSNSAPPAAARKRLSVLHRYRIGSITKTFEAVLVLLGGGAGFCSFAASDHWQITNGYPHRLCRSHVNAPGSLTRLGARRRRSGHGRGHVPRRAGSSPRRAVHRHPRLSASSVVRGIRTGQRRRPKNLPHRCPPPTGRRQAPVCRQLKKDFPAAGDDSLWENLYGEGPR